MFWMLYTSRATGNIIDIDVYSPETGVFIYRIDLALLVASQVVNAKRKIDIAEKCSAIGCRKVKVCLVFIY